MSDTCNQRPNLQPSAVNHSSSRGIIPVTNPASLAALSNTHYIVAEEVTVGVPMVRPKQNFLNILKEGGATGEVFTKKEVCSFLRAYISSRQLFDPNDPRIVFCEDDPLGKVFSVDKFTISDAIKLIDANCYQLPDTCIKRKQHLVARPKNGTSAGNTHPESQVITTVAGSNSVRIQVCSPSPIISSTSSTGIQSSQSSSQGSVTTASSNNTRKNRKKGRNVSGDSSSSSGRHRQTSLSINISDNESSSYPWYFSVQMDSDTDTDQKDDNDDVEDVISVEVDSDRIEVEYEVGSDDDTIISSTASVSGISENNLYIICGDSDMEFWADSSDSELSDGDKWTCVECNTQNSPIHGYCLRCWKMRPGWLPEKRTQTKRQLERSDSKNKEELSSSESSEKYPSLRKRKNRKSSVESESANLSSEHCITSLVEKSPRLETYRTLLNYQSTESIKTETSVPLGDNSSNFISSYEHDIGTISNEKTDNVSGPATSLSLVSANSEIENNSLPYTKVENDRLTNITTENSPKSSVAAISAAVLEPCIICLQRPKSASIVHGCTGHQVCCFRCARRLKRRGKPCPVCRRPIQKVIRNFLV